MSEWKPIPEGLPAAEDGWPVFRMPNEGLCFLTPCGQYLITIDRDEDTGEHNVITWKKGENDLNNIFTAEDIG